MRSAFSCHTPKKSVGLTAVVSTLSCVSMRDWFWSSRRRRGRRRCVTAGSCQWQETQRSRTTWSAYQNTLTFVWMRKLVLKRFVSFSWVWLLIETKCFNILKAHSWDVQLPLFSLAWFFWLLWKDVCCIYNFNFLAFRYLPNWLKWLKEPPVVWYICKRYTSPKL